MVRTLRNRTAQITGQFVAEIYGQPIIDIRECASYSLNRRSRGNSIDDVKLEQSH